VVKLVNHLVERAIVQSAVEPVMPCILHDEEDSNMEGHLAERRERNAEIHAEVGSDRVEEPNLRKFDGEVAQEDKASAFPLFLESWYFLLQQMSANWSRLHLLFMYSVYARSGSCIY